VLVPSITVGFNQTRLFKHLGIERKYAVLATGWRPE